MAVTITKAPTKHKITVTGYTRTRNEYTLTWKVDSSAVKDTADDRIQEFHVFLGVLTNTSIPDYRVTAKGKTWGWQTITAESGTTTYSASITIDESVYYPKVTNYAKYFKYYVQGFNKPYKSINQYGTTAVSNDIAIYVPPLPTVGGTRKYDNATNTMTCTVQSPEYYTNQPRSTVQVRVWRLAYIGGKYYNGNNNDGKPIYEGWPLGADNANSGKEETYTYTDKTAPALTSANDWVRWIVYARCQGYCGARPSNKVDTHVTTNLYKPNIIDEGYWRRATIFKAYPAKPSKPIVKLAGANALGGLNVTWNDNWSYQRPTETTKVQLAYAMKQSLIDETSWTDVTDDFTNTERKMACSAFVPASSIKNAVGEHVYLRILAEGQCGQVASDVVLVNDKWYYTDESPQGDAPASVVQITQANSGGDNSSLDCVIGYATDSKYNACEISYSTDQKAWTSTKDPSTYEMRDTYWQDKKRKSTSHANTSSISICDLDEGTTYFMRARRINLSDTEKRTLWSAVVRGNTSKDEVAGLQLTGVDKVATEQGATFSWKWSSELTQTGWSLVNADTKQGFAWAEDGATSAEYAFPTAGTYNVYLHATYSDGSTSDSNTVSLQVVDKPTASVTLSSETLSAIPFTFDVTASAEDVTTTVQVISPIGCRRNYPDGEEVQYSGDVLYSQDVTGASNTITLEDASWLFDGGYYLIRAVPTQNGIKGDSATATFNVEYSSVVELPTDDNIVIGKDETAKTAQVQVNNLAEGLTWSLYRSSADGRSTLIASELASGDVITDPYAPYSKDGQCEYTILAENTNKQIDTLSVSYSLKGSVLRFDWDNDKSLEVPYNLSISDSNDKQFEQQLYLDGSQKGSWGASVVRTASLSTDLIYIEDEERLKLVRELARYQGAVFVRTPLGQAYCANVEVDDVSKEYDSKVMAVSFDVTEIDTTSEFKAGRTS
jgi:hypothetical protein